MEGLRGWTIYEASHEKQDLKGNSDETNEEKWVRYYHRGWSCGKRDTSFILYARAAQQSRFWKLAMVHSDFKTIVRQSVSPKCLCFISRVNVLCNKHNFVLNIIFFSFSFFGVFPVFFVLFFFTPLFGGVVLQRLIRTHAIPVRFDWGDEFVGEQFIMPCWEL